LPFWADTRVCPYIAFVSVAYLDFGVFGGCLLTVKEVNTAVQQSCIWRFPMKYPG